MEELLEATIEVIKGDTSELPSKGEDYNNI